MDFTSKDIELVCLQRYGLLLKYVVKLFETCPLSVDA